MLTYDNEWDEVYKAELIAQCVIKLKSNNQSINLIKKRIGFGRICFYLPDIQTDNPVFPYRILTDNLAISCRISGIRLD